MAFPNLDLVCIHGLASQLPMRDTGASSPMHVVVNDISPFLPEQAPTKKDRRTTL